MPQTPPAPRNACKRLPAKGKSATKAINNQSCQCQPANAGLDDLLTPASSKARPSRKTGASMLACPEQEGHAISSLPKKARPACAPAANARLNPVSSPSLPASAPATPPTNEAGKTLETSEVGPAYVLARLASVAEQCLQEGQAAGAIKALELLGKHLNMFADKSGINVIVDLAHIIKKARERVDAS